MAAATPGSGTASHTDRAPTALATPARAPPAAPPAAGPLLRPDQAYCILLDLLPVIDSYSPKYCRTILCFENLRSAAARHLDREIVPTFSMASAMPCTSSTRKPVTPSSTI